MTVAADASSPQRAVARSPCSSPSTGERRSSTSSTSSRRSRRRSSELGGTALTYDAQEDPSLTLTLMNDAVSAGATGIAVSAQSSDLGPALAEIADAAGVAWVATDSTQVDSAGDPIPFVGFDGTAMGNAVGQEVLRQLDASGMA